MIRGAGQLAQFLDSKGRRCDNALAVLNLYDEKCLPALLGACAALGVGGRSRVLNVLYSLLQDLPQAPIKEQLSTYQDALLVLLTDKRPIVLDYRGPVEIDFAGRLCDDAYIIIQVLLIPDADVSEFRRAKKRGIASLISFFASWDLRLSVSAPIILNCCSEGATAAAR
ncbi:MAG: hypothetical protein IPL81_05745 [Flavobacteriales bacterium]|nr:hypothetical protein [Flavobacteriales bacterium]